MSSNYQQKKMMNALGAIDTKGNIVLEQFQDGTALLFQPGNAQPFCVATDYDRATASWSYGKYFSDLGCAHEAADPEIIEDASVRWVQDFSPLAAQRPALNHPLRGWRQTALQSHPSDRY